MSVNPTTIHNKKTCQDTPIWEVHTANGYVYKIVRELKKGLVPLTVYGECFYTREDGLVVCDAKIPILKGRLISAADGFKVPRSWYGYPGETIRDLRPVPEPESDSEDFEEEFPSLPAPKFTCQQTALDIDETCPADVCWADLLV